MNNVDEPPLIRGKNYIILIIIMLSLFQPTLDLTAADNKIIVTPKTAWNTTQMKAPLLMIAKTFAPIKKNINWKVYGNGTCVPYARYKTGIQLFGWAGTFLIRAEAAGYAISTIPAKGGMVVTNESNGHVAVVEEIMNESIIVSEQNYNGLHVVSTREISLNSPKIQGYIRILLQNPYEHHLTIR